MHRVVLLSDFLSERSEGFWEAAEIWSSWWKHGRCLEQLATESWPSHDTDRPGGLVVVGAAFLKISLNFGQTEDERLFSDEDQNKDKKGTIFL